MFNFIKYNFNTHFGGWIFLSLFTLLYIISLWHRNPHVDDAWIGEQAYWMSEIGFVKSELMRGITNQETKNIVHHKFFTLNGALFIKLFGFSLWSLKSVSLIWLGIFLFSFVKYLKIKFSQFWFLGILIFTFHSFIFEFSFVYRPEIMVMALGFFSFVYLEKFFDTNEIKFNYLMYAGLFAGLAATAHLNGLIFSISGLILLMYKKRIWASLIFGFSTLPTILIYFYDFSSIDDFSFWLYQFGKSPALESENISPVYVFMQKILDEHKLFFHSPKEIIFTLLFIFIVLITFKYLKQNKILLVYLFSLIFSLSAISVHNASRYIIMYLPFMTLVMMEGISFLRENESYKWQIKTLNTLFLFYFIIHLYYNISVSLKKFYAEDNRILSESLFKNKTKDISIIAPMEFIFNEIKYYKRIQSDLGYMDLVRSNNLTSVNEFLVRAKSHNIDFIIINPVFDKFLNISKEIAFIEQKQYSVWKTSEPYIILKRNDYTFSKFKKAIIDEIK